MGDLLKRLELADTLRGRWESDYARHWREMGTVVRMKRERMGISLRELARRVDRSATIISNLECNGQPVSRELLKSIDLVLTTVNNGQQEK